MKPERKEQLETNDLEVFLRVKLPKIWKKHGNTFLLLLLLVCAAIAFWNYRRSQMKELEGLSQNNLAVAWDMVGELRRHFLLLDLSDDATAERMRLTRKTLDTFDAVLSTNPKPYSKAWAILGRSEIYWMLANAPKEAITTTQPVLGPSIDSSQSYLEMAEDGYKQILTNHADQSRAVTIAMFAMAAIEENRKSFDQAASWYDKIIESPKSSKADKSFARRRKSMLDEFNHPLLIKGTTVPSSKPGL